MSPRLLASLPRSFSHISLPRLAWVLELCLVMSLSVGVALAQAPWAALSFSGSGFATDYAVVPATQAGTAGFSQASGGASASASGLVDETSARATLRLGAVALAGSAGMSSTLLVGQIEVLQPCFVEVEISAGVLLYEFPTLGLTATGAAVVNGPFGFGATVAAPQVLMRRNMQMLPGVPVSLGLGGFAQVTAAPCPYPGPAPFGWGSQYQASASLVIRRITLNAYDGLSRNDGGAGPWSYLSGWTADGASGITDDAARLIHKGEEREIVAADGTARLLLAFAAPLSRASWPVRFRVEHDGQEVSGTSAHGLIGEPGGTLQPLTTSTAQPRMEVGDSQCHWFLVYRAPDDFVRQSQQAADTAAVSRTLKFKVEWLDPSTQQWSLVHQVDLELRRAPIVLAHDVWGEPADFENGPFQAAVLADPRFAAFAIDYSAASSRRLADSCGIVPDTILPGGRLRAELDKRYPDGFAYARADWVGHGLGGLLPQVAAKELPPQNWISVASFGRPPVRKLIMLDVPGYGSPVTGFAATLMKNVWMQMIAGFGEIEDNGVLEDLAQASGYFQPGPGALGPLAGVRAHALIGTGVEVWMLEGRILAAKQVAKEGTGWALVAAGVILSGALSPEILYRRYPDGWIIPHDLVVDEVSQSAGLTYPAWTRYQDTGGPSGLPPWTLHNQVTFAGDYATRVQELLLAPISGSLFGELPGVPAALTSAATSAADAPLVFHDLGPIAWTNGPTSVAPGAVLDLQLTSIPPGLDSLFVIGMDGSAQVVEAPFLVHVPVPLDAVGTFAVRAVAFDGLGGYSVAPEFVVPVNLAAVPTQLLVGEPSVLFTAPLETHGVSIEAMFSDGQLRPLHPGAMWPTFTNSHPEVVEVQANGMLRALEPGTSTIEVRLGTLLATFQAVVTYPAVRHYGAGTRGSGGLAPALDVPEPAWVGSEGCSFVLERAVGGTLGVLVVGVGPNRLPVLGVDLLVDPALLYLQTLTTTGMAGAAGQGTADVPVTILTTPELLGLTFFAQALVLDDAAPMGFASSNGVAVRILGALSSN